ncbi:glutathione S-transferase T3-like [Arachis stenosperma]|uniref:glutathione S-transferase T3-like n=1 Tax=Arachis stenosperma TaxID=217475 RepID=UPI0025ACB3DA|nr:glutathione S-transferase T3-like [Arachis stenosperma]
MDPNQLNSFFNYLQNFPQIPNTQQSQTSNTQVPNKNFTLPNTFQNPNPQNLSNFNFQAPYNNQFPIFQPQNQNSQTPHFPFSSIFNPSIGNVTPTSLPIPTQFSTSRHNASGVGGSSNPSSQTPIQSSPNSPYSDFANPRGLDAIDLNDDDIEDRRQDSIQHWHWEEDEMLISAWLNVSIDPVVGTDQKGETFWSRIHSYCVEFCTDMTRGVVACKKRWYKINKAVAQFAGCYDQASRNIRSGSNADDIKELAYKLYSTNYGQKFTFERHWNMLRLEQKWRSQLPTQSGGSKRTKVSATGAYSSSSNPETPLADEPGVDSPVRPQGSKKSKRRGKGKAQMSEDCSERKSSVVKKLSLMEDIKNVREKELMEREKEREEEKEHRAKMMAIKEKELQIQAAMKEQELQTQRYIKEMEIKAKEREMDMQILNADTSTMSEKRRALHEIACEKIMAKWFT